MPTSSGDGLSWLKLPARRDSLERFRGFVISVAEGLAAPPGVLGKIDLTLEEILLNVMDYAYGPEQGGNMEVGCGGDGAGRFSIVVRDKGRPFNPLNQKPPDLTADIEQRGVGGLGVYLTTQMADLLDYRREQEENVFTVAFNLNETART